MLRYAWRAAFLVFVPSTAVFLAFFFAVSHFDTVAAHSRLGGIVSGSVAVLAVAATGRWQLSLPASAIGEIRPTLSNSWRLTQGSTLPLVGGLLACGLPFEILSQVVDYAYWAVAAAAITDDGTVSYLLYVAGYITVVTDLMGSVVGAAFLSFAYLHFTRSEPSGLSVASYFS